MEAKPPPRTPPERSGLLTAPPVGRRLMAPLPYAMEQAFEDDYITLGAARDIFGLSSGQLSRILREHGLGEFVRASMDREVLVRRRDLEAIIRPTAQGPKRRKTA